MRSVNPFTNRPVKEYQNHTESDVNQIVSSVAQAWSSWRKTSFPERADYLLKLEDQLLHDREQLAGTMVAEMGKIKREALGEIQKCAGLPVLCGKRSPFSSK